MAEVFEIAWWVFFSSVKFLFSPSSVYLSGYNYLQTILITITGGWLGVLVFYYTGGYIVDWTNQVLNRKNKKKKAFRKRNRLIISIKNRFGVIGLALISPSLISIPFGCLLAAKYYRNDRRTVPIFMSAVVFWSFVLTSLSALGGLMF